MSDTPTPEKLVNGLVELLTVEKRASDIYRGSPQKGGMGRVFGGQVLAQALQAAQKAGGLSRAGQRRGSTFGRG
ncbi:MAG: acyl-CoA thioesterase II, partial [Pseudomonadota bacterium]